MKMLCTTLTFERTSRSASTPQKERPSSRSARSARASVIAADVPLQTVYEIPG